MAEELTLEQIGTHLRIEEESRIRESTNSVSKVNEGTVNNLQNGGIGTVKHIRVSGLTRKSLRRIIPTKTKRIRPVFIVERKVTISENADS